MNNPTNELYSALQIAYTHLNDELFKSSLPSVLFTVHKQKGMLGYFVPERWASAEGKNCHEISINPANMGHSSLLDVLQTLCHEMVHCWQYCFGTPPTTGYHDKEWAYKMIDVGLQPSHNGLPGGDILGYQMSDYVIKDGAFIKSCARLIEANHFTLPWVYRLHTPIQSDNPESSSTLVTETISTPDELLSVEYVDNDQDKLSHIGETLFTSFNELMPKETFFDEVKVDRKKYKTKYTCSGCDLNVWAKNGVRLKCMDCNVELKPD